MVHWALMDGLLRLIRRGTDWPRSLFGVPNVMSQSPISTGVAIVISLNIGVLQRAPACTVNG